MNKNEIIDILKDENIGAELFKQADEIRKKHVGDKVYLRGLIEFSNFCKYNCLYCGLRRDNKDVQRYRLSEDEIFETAKKAKNLGFKTVVLQSGEDPFFSVEKIIPIIKRIKSLDMALTLSVGEKTFEEYKTYKDAGADRYLVRIETTDRKLYEKMHPRMDWDNRKECLKSLKILGFEVGTGCLVGLPNQTLESLADDILFFKEIGADMLGIGPFIPSPYTPLIKEKGGDFWLALKVISLARILIPNANIPATTAMETLHPSGRILTLQSGANVVMPNLTDENYKKLYEIYPNKTSIDKKTLEIMLKEIGRTVD